MNIYNVFRNYKGLSYQEIIDKDPKYVDFVIYSLFNYNLSVELRQLRKYEFDGPVTTRVRLFLSKYFDKMEEYKKELKLDATSFYELDFSDEFISFLYALRKIDPSLTGIWFDYFFRYVLDFPNFDDNRMKLLEEDIKYDNGEISDDNETEIVNIEEHEASDDSDSDIEIMTFDERLVDFTEEEKIKFKTNFRFAFNKNSEKIKLNALEVFDLCLAHPLFFGDSIKNYTLFREKVKFCNPNFEKEIEQFKTVWPTYNTNPGYQYEDYFEGDGDIEIENEVIEIKLINRIPDNFVIFQLLTYASMSSKTINYISSLQPLLNRFFQWDISHITKDQRVQWLERLNTGEFDLEKKLDSTNLM